MADVADSLGRLRAEREQLETRLVETAAELTEITQARGAATSDDEHDPEGSTLSMDWSRLEGTRLTLEARLAASDAALERARAGSYGICERCGQAIAAERLEALPATLYCIECARELDERR